MPWLGFLLDVSWIGNFYELNFVSKIFFPRLEGFVSTYGLDATHGASRGEVKQSAFNLLLLPKAKVNVIKSTSGKSTAEQLGKLDRLCTLSQLICPGTQKNKPQYANVELNKCPKAEYIPG